MKHGFEWDLNTWFINQFGHPDQGSNYFTAGPRAPPAIARACSRARPRS